MIDLEKVKFWMLQKHKDHVSREGSETSSQDDFWDGYCSKSKY